MVVPVLAVPVWVMTRSLASSKFTTPVLNTTVNPTSFSDVGPIKSELIASAVGTGPVFVSAAWATPVTLKQAPRAIHAIA
jgi:hypothetical protein